MRRPYSVRSQRTKLTLILKGSKSRLAALGWAIPVRLEGFWACIDFVQYDRISLVMRDHYLEFQRAWFCREIVLRMCLQVLQVFIPLARDGLIGRTDYQFADAFLPAYEREMANLSAALQ